jgi:Rad3-related DNA helicase
MSGSFIDAGSWAESVGVEAAGLSWDLVTVPMEWDRKHRPIICAPVADMKKANQDTAFPKVMDELVKIRRRHESENMLVHSVTYTLMRQAVAWFRREGIEAISYEGAGDRAIALQRFKHHGGVIVAPSLDRGVDLPGEMCTVQCLMKVPFASLGDPQIRERMSLPGGNVWYNIAVARSLVQMAGRGVRFDGDRCALYILDQGFGTWYGKWSRLLPKYWKSAIVAGLPDDWMDGE